MPDDLSRIIKRLVSLTHGGVGYMDTPVCKIRFFKRTLLYVDVDIWGSSEFLSFSACRKMEFSEDFVVERCV